MLTILWFVCIFCAPPPPSPYYRNFEHGVCKTVYCSQIFLLICFYSWKQGIPGLAAFTFLMISASSVKSNVLFYSKTAKYWISLHLIGHRLAALKVLPLVKQMPWHIDTFNSYSSKFFLVKFRVRNSFLSHLSCFNIYCPPPPNHHHKNKKFTWVITPQVSLDPSFVQRPACAVREVWWQWVWHGGQPWSQKAA